MLTWIREKFGTVIIGGIIGFIAFVFVFYGVFSPKATRGLHEGAVAGTINGDRISISEFNRELNRRIEFFKNMAGGETISEEQLKAFRIRELVFNDLAVRKLLIQEAQSRGMVPSDEEVRDQVRQIPAFQKDGKFDLITYKQALEANQYSPGGFEEAIREDLSQQKWRDFFKNRVHVSEGEVKREFLINSDKRNVKYVVLTTDSVQKDIPVQDKEIDQFLANPGQLSLVTSKYEAGKKTTYQGQKLEEVIRPIARTILASQRVDEGQKRLQALGEQVVSKLGIDRASDAKVNALLKPYGVQLKTTGLVSQTGFSIPQVSENADLIKDVFAQNSPLDPKTGGRAKTYPLAGKILVAVVTETAKPQMAGLANERETVAEKVAGRKMQSVYSDFVGELFKKAKIDTNPAVIADRE